MIKWEELSKAVVLPLAISGLMTVGNVVINSNTNQKLLEANIQSTNELSKAVQDLRFQMAIFGEKYVTRTELDRTLSRLDMIKQRQRTEEDYPNGS